MGFDWRLLNKDEIRQQEHSEDDEQVFEWLSVSSSLEIEQERIKNTSLDKTTQTLESDEAYTFDIEFGLDLNDYLSGLLVVEAEHDTEIRSKVDEARITLELEPGDFFNNQSNHIPVKISAGWFYIRFSGYNSYFITGPLTEFSDIRSDVLGLETALLESVKLTGYIFKNRRKMVVQRQNQDWGIGFAYVPDEEIFSASINYLSDLRGSEDSEFTDEIFLTRRVPAWSFQTQFSKEPFEFSLEWIITTGADASKNIPKQVTLN